MMGLIGKMHENSGNWLITHENPQDLAGAITLFQAIWRRPAYRIPIHRVDIISQPADFVVKDDLDGTICRKPSGFKQK